MPDHLVDILELDIVVDIIGLCDSILYKVINMYIQLKSCLDLGQNALLYFWKRCHQVCSAVCS